MLTENLTQANEHTPLPVARTKDLVVNELPDELLVYDLKTNKAHCLNQSANLVWKHCDGKTSVADLTLILSEELHTQVDADIVWLALGQLSKARLLEEQAASPLGKGRLSRRVVIRKLGRGVAVAATLPLVMSILAPTAQAACTGASPNAPLGSRCCTNTQCASTCCDVKSGGFTCINTSTSNRTTGAACTNNNQCCSNNCVGAPSGSCA
jgi:hypothetical protein